MGTLIGVGVGPGDPELMTLRAVSVLNNVPVLAIPRKNDTSQSVAWRIAQVHVGDVPGQKRLYLRFPMTKDPAVLNPAWKLAMDEIGRFLLAGEDVAFITEGDPFVYSTFVYMVREARKRWPDIEVQVVPAVSSISAVPAAVGVPLADGLQRVAVIPATYGLGDLPRILSMFDTIVLMKVSSVMAELVALLERHGLLAQAVYVSKASFAEQRIVWDLKSIGSGRCDYFSMVMVNQAQRAGVLSGNTGSLPARDFKGGRSGGLDAV